MKHNMQYNINAERGDFELGINYQVSGSYRKQTWFEPAEYPEVDILDIKVISHKLADGSETIREVPEWLEDEIEKEMDNIKEKALNDDTEMREDARADYLMSAQEDREIGAY